MPRIYFEEIQHLRASRTVWMLTIAISFAVLVPLMDAFYWQLMKGEPWGNKPLSDNGLIFLFLFVMMSLAGLIVLLFSIKLETRIDDTGVHYRLVPLKSQWKTITRDQVAAHRLEKMFWIFDSEDFYKNWNKNQSFRILGTHHLYIKMVNGDKVFIGTQHPGSAEWAMKKLMTKNEQT